MILFLLFTSALASGRRHTWLADTQRCVDVTCDYKISGGKMESTEMTQTGCVGTASHVSGDADDFQFKVTGDTGMGDTVTVTGHPNPKFVGATGRFYNLGGRKSIYWVPKGPTYTCEPMERGSYMEGDMVTMAGIRGTHGDAKWCQQNVFAKDCTYVKTESVKLGMTETTCADLGVSKSCPKATLAIPSDCTADGMGKTERLTMEYFVTEGAPCPMPTMEGGSYMEGEGKKPFHFCKHWPFCKHHHHTEMAVADATQVVISMTSTVGKITTCLQNKFECPDGFDRKALGMGWKVQSCDEAGVSVSCWDEPNEMLHGVCNPTDSREVDMTLYATSEEECKKQWNPTDTRMEGKMCKGYPFCKCKHGGTWPLCKKHTEQNGSVAVSKAAESNVSVFVQGFAVLGFGFTLYGAYKHYSK